MRSGATADTPAECLVLPAEPGFPADAANDARMTQLALAIEREIIPRLMLAHRLTPDGRAEARPAGGEVLGRRDVLQFAKLVLAPEDDRSLAAVQDIRARGISVEAIYLDLLAPTARYLGELWTEDLCSFTDVTVGLGRLQRVLRELSPAFGEGVDHPTDGRRVLLLPSPGEQHTFGLVMVSEFFMRAGWDVSGGPWSTGAEAAAMVKHEWFDVVGFSIGADVHIDRLRRSIEEVRHGACNSELAILVGGPVFAIHPEYFELLHADGMTIDGREAPALAERLIVRLRKH